MAQKFLVFCAVIVLSANLANAIEGNTAKSVSPAPAVKNDTRESVSPAPPKLFKDPATGIELLYVKGGCYQMGNLYDEPDLELYPEEKPVHEVCVDDFYIGKYEVTQGQWKKIMGRNTAALNICKEDTCPVNYISWNDTQDFIKRLNSKSGGNKYRLPTEAEWEYAARSGGKRERYSGGDDVNSVAWYLENSGDRVHPVGTKAPNGLGIYDMSGNAWEMTNDWYSTDYYSMSPRDNPTGPGDGEAHTKRGGCDGGMKYNQRTSRRNPTSDTGLDDRERVEGTGFRLGRTP